LIDFNYSTTKRRKATLIRKRSSSNRREATLNKRITQGSVEGLFNNPPGHESQITPCLKR